MKPALLLIGGIALTLLILRLARLPDGYRLPPDPRFAERKTNREPRTVTPEAVTPGPVTE